MAKKTKKTPISDEKLTNLVEKPQDFKAQVLGDVVALSENYDPTLLKPITTPSVVTFGDTQEIQLCKLDPKDIEKYLWMHPVIPRGVEMKSNRMVRNGYTIFPKDPNNATAKEAAEYCRKIIENSGGVIFLSRWIKDTFSFGNGYWTLVPNKLGNEIIKLNPEHPIFFRPASYPNSNGDYNSQSKELLKINPNTKEISYFTQVRYKNNASSGNQYEPVGKEIPANLVAHLMFDRYGDEPTGISLVQYIFLNIKYLLNLEEAAAERLWRDGFPRQKVTTEITNEKDLKKLAKTIRDINSKDAIILPKGIDTNILNASTTDFPQYHNIFIKLLGIRLGIPMPLLTLDATSTNKACYSEDTEVLTDKGFKFYWELNENDKVVQYSPKNNILEEVNYSNLVTFKIKEKMYNFKNKTNDIFVTDNHRMLFKESRQKEYKIDEARNIKNRRIKFKFSGEWKNSNKLDKIIIPAVESKSNLYNSDLIMDIDDYLEFIGYYLSEGGFSTEPLKENGRKIYNITFAQKNSNNIMYNFFNKLNKKYNLHIGNYLSECGKYTHYNLCNKQIWNHLLKEKYGSYCYEKNIPRRLLNLPKEKLNILLDALIYGDGTTVKNKKRDGRVYYTTSEILADNIQELAFKCGFSATKHIHYLENDKRIRAWRVFISKREEGVLDLKTDLKITDYDGLVWCLKVPSGIFVTRRNSKIAIHGNTLDEQRKDINADYSMDEKIVEETITNRVFKSACEIKYGKGFDLIPDFKFNEIPEEENEKVERFVKTSSAILNVTSAIQRLSDSGIALSDNRVVRLLDYLDKAVQDAKTLKATKPDNIQDLNEVEPAKEKIINVQPTGTRTTQE